MRPALSGNEGVSIVLKRQLLLASFSAADIERLRLLVMYTARIDTIKALLPLPHIEAVARLLYEITPDSKPPRGAKAPVSRLIAKTYSNRASRLALNEMNNQFDDLRKLGFSFQDSIVSVYTTYARKNHQTLCASQTSIPVIRFEHFYSIALDLEAKQSNLIRCTGCGSRNLLTRHLSSYSLQCVFCDISEANRGTTVTRDVEVG